MRIRTEVAAVLKQFSIASVQAQIEAEALAAQQNLQVGITCMVIFKYDRIIA